jgi:hypothetical protein
MTPQPQQELTEYTLTMILQCPSKMREEGIRRYIHGRIFSEDWGEAFQTNYIHSKSFKLSRPHTSTPNLHTCTHKEIRNGVEFCHYYDSPTDPATIVAQAREKVLDEIFHSVDCLTLNPKRANEKQCNNCSLKMSHVECYQGNVLDTREMFDGCLLESLRSATSTAGDEGK